MTGRRRSSIPSPYMCTFLKMKKDATHRKLVEIINKARREGNQGSPQRGGR